MCGQDKRERRLVAVHAVTVLMHAPVEVSGNVSALGRHCLDHALPGGVFQGCAGARVTESPSSVLPSQIGPHGKEIIGQKSAQECLLVTTLMHGSCIFGFASSAPGVTAGIVFFPAGYWRSEWTHGNVPVKAVWRCVRSTLLLRPGHPS